jgi:hypothetical protein
MTLLARTSSSLTDRPTETDTFYSDVAVRQSPFGGEVGGEVFSIVGSLMKM